MNKLIEQTNESKNHNVSKITISVDMETCKITIGNTNINFKMLDTLRNLNIFNITLFDNNKYHMYNITIEYNIDHYKLFIQKTNLQMPIVNNNFIDQNNLFVVKINKYIEQK